MNEWPEQEPTVISGERRARPRYALKLPLEYRTIDGRTEIIGTGTTRDLSRLGIAFETGEELPPDSHVELSIEWPAIPGGADPPRLIVRGLVTRSQAGLAAVRVMRMEFADTRRMAAGSVSELS
jgi:hypothetical protein